MSAAKTLAEALVAAQAEMPAVEPDKTNPHFKSRFVSLDHLIAKTRPVLNKHGLAIVQLPAVSDLGAPVLRTILAHTSGEQIVADAPLFLPSQDMQKLGAAITYQRRYAWASACGIASEEDDDGNTASAGSGAAKGKTPGASSRGRGAASAPAGGGGGTDGNQTAAAPSPHPALTAEREKTLLDLAARYAGLVPEWDGFDKLTEACAAHRGDGGWFDRALTKMRANLENAPAAVEAAARERFPLPESVRAAQAADEAKEKAA